MKYLLLTLLSFSAIAQDKTLLESSFKVLSNPGEAILETCAEQAPPPEPAWCSNLSQAVCALPPKPTDSLPALVAQLDTQFFVPLTKLKDKKGVRRRATANERANAKIKAIAEAERIVPQRTGVSFADIQSEFTKAITSIKATLQATSIDATTKGNMTVALNNLKPVTGIQYIAAYVADMKANNPGTTDEAAKTAALTAYEGVCGFDGMSNNAYNHMDMVVVCPGMIQSLADYGTSKDKMLMALSSTMGHEIGHTIDASVFPTAYTSFEACQTANTSVPSYSWANMQGEISSDFWGVDTYTKRIAAEGLTGQDALTNFNMAADGYCTIGGDTEHPEAINRIDEYFGRNSQMRTNLSCTTPPSKPACGL